MGEGWEETQRTYFSRVKGNWDYSIAGLLNYALVLATSMGGSESLRENDCGDAGLEARAWRRSILPTNEWLDNIPTHIRLYYPKCEGQTPRPPSSPVV